jgi:hypothetical protein
MMVMANLDEVINAAANVMRCRAGLRTCEEASEHLFKERRVHLDKLKMAEDQLRAVMGEKAPKKEKKRR